EAQTFLTCNSRFLANRESAEVYWNPKAFLNNAPPEGKKGEKGNTANEGNNLTANSGLYDSAKSSSKFQSRSVMPQQGNTKDEVKLQSKQSLEDNISKLAPSETEFRQLIGDATDGTLARFVDDKLNV